MLLCFTQDLNFSAQKNNDAILPCLPDLYQMTGKVKSEFGFGFAEDLKHIRSFGLTHYFTLNIFLHTDCQCLCVHVFKWEWKIKLVNENFQII